MAKITPQEIDTAEIHDAFSVCELMAVEDLSLTEKILAQCMLEIYSIQKTENKSKGRINRCWTSFRCNRYCSDCRNYTAITK